MRFIATALLVALATAAFAEDAPPAPKAEEPMQLRLPNPSSQQPQTESQNVPRWAFAYSAYQRGHYLSAFRMATFAAEKEQDAAAMTLLGEFYAEGLGIAQSDEKAVNWLRLAAERGDRNALFALGMAHLRGKVGQGRDLSQAALFFNRAAEAGHVAAMYNLGLLYLGGQGVTADATKAADYFRKAAEAGNAEAQYALANLYREGAGVPRDGAKLLGWLEKAAAQDLTDAQVDLAIALFNGAGVPKNEREAANLFRKAALRGNVVAQNRYARLLASGRAVEAPKPVEAATWFFYSKAQGLDDAYLEDMAAKLPVAQREAAFTRAENWLRAKSM